MRGTKPASQGVPLWLVLQRMMQRRGQSRGAVQSHQGVTFKPKVQQMPLPPLPSPVPGSGSQAPHPSGPGRGCQCLIVSEAPKQALGSPSALPSAPLCPQPLGERSSRDGQQRRAPRCTCVHREPQPAGARGKAHTHHSVLLTPCSWCSVKAQSMECCVTQSLLCHGGPCWAPCSRAMI